ncbi:MAG TPA: RelA/SpoT domain-containing protein [Flavisolibacter sp.]|nr:RelA/SpoT domain-containing protein [Flavisolibacter sp.]
MSRAITIEEAKSQHQAIFSKYDSFCREISRQIENLLEAKNVKVAVPIQYRAKQWESIENKISQGRFSIKKHISELQDLAGVRIILLFKRDTLKVVEALRDSMVVIKEYNTEERLKESEFGYLSVHMVLRLHDDWIRVPSLSNFKDLKLEVQIRTLAQHNWAEASKIFQYKNEESVPKPLRRGINRVSALLEIVDFEFERLILERLRYKDEIKEDQSDKDIAFDVDQLEDFLDKNLPADNKLDSEEFSELLQQLKVLEYNSLYKLRDLIGRRLDEALKEDKDAAAKITADHLQGVDQYLVERFGKGVFFSHVGLIRTMLTYELGQPFYEALKERENGSTNDDS